MPATIIDGKKIAADIKDEVKAKVESLSQRGIQVTLAVVLVGENPASQVYVRNKERACEYCGIHSRKILLPEETTQEELLSIVQELNNDGAVNGILVQLPLPKQIDENTIIQAILPEKDVDCFHPQSVGAMSEGLPGFLPCTPAGVIQLLKRSNIATDGAECVIVGRSNIVGKPMALLMLRENATVTITHSHTKDLKEVCKRADILITAIGKARMIGSDFVKPGATVIDCGINRDENGKLCGDVDFDKVSEIAGAITPVPGGVGPMTVAMLMQNCVANL